MAHQIQNAQLKSDLVQNPLRRFNGARFTRTASYKKSFLFNLRQVNALFITAEFDSVAFRELYMTKKIVFCADGTWAHPQSPALVEDADTNVYKLYKCLAYTATQATFYDDGVGAGGNLFRHLLGGAIGQGLFQKVKDGYTAIAHVYDPNDTIYIFGFSRGAYTARSLAGMIAICGLPTKPFDTNFVETAFQAYRDSTQRSSLLATLTSYSLFDAKITCVGVWDTVGSLGIPIDPFGIDDAIYGFLDTKLHPDVLNAFHAVSIDERRREFPPTLWTPPFAVGQTVEQMWFAGVHSDVGGGYSQSGLSDVTLNWILKSALACDPANPLELVDPNTGYLTVEPKNSLDQTHESWNLLWGFPHRRSVPQTADIANSVEIRITQDLNYRPQNLQLTSTGLAPGYVIHKVV
jgi:Uncharacterized alpha/beta hydrolase domain (DUF2235)